MNLGLRVLPNYYFTISIRVMTEFFLKVSGLSLDLPSTSKYDGRDVDSFILH